MSGIRLCIAVGDLVCAALQRGGGFGKILDRVTRGLKSLTKVAALAYYDQISLVPPVYKVTRVIKVRYICNANRLIQAWRRTQDLIERLR